MEYRRLGKSGLKISSLSFGSWVTFANQVDRGLAKTLLKTAYEAGVNFFDNAEAYAHGESEVIMGEALKKLAFSRDTYSVSSKVFWGGGLPTQIGLSKKHVTEACHAALKRLQLEYLDLYFCHRPDPQTPISETVWAMHNLVTQGKVLYWGTSEWPVHAILAAYDFAIANHLTPPTMEQPQYNIFTRHKVEQEFIPAYQLMGLGTTTWSPLASGMLTGKYNQGIPSQSRATLTHYEWLNEKIQSPEGQIQLQIVESLKKIAEELNCSLAQLAIAWCLKNPNVSTVILGASQPQQLIENLEALDILPQLDEHYMQQIEKLTQTPNIN